MADRFGSAGTRLDWDLRVGDTLLFEVTQAKDEAGALINYSGATFDAKLWPRTASGPGTPVALTVAVTGLGAYKVTLPSGTAAFVANNFFTGQPAYEYAVAVTMAAVKTTEFYGLIHTFEAAPT